jgi:hypothetical protein
MSCCNHQDDGVLLYGVSLCFGRATTRWRRLHVCVPGACCKYCCAHAQIGVRYAFSIRVGWVLHGSCVQLHAAGVVSFVCVCCCRTQAVPCNTRKPAKVCWQPLSCCAHDAAAVCVCLHMQLCTCFSVPFACLAHVLCTAHGLSSTVSH